MNKKFFVCASLAACAVASHALVPEGLMVDLAEKAGHVTVSSEKPCFSWGFSAGEKGEAQSAYQVQVATSTGKFRANKPDLWDSGKVLSSNSLCISYDGAALPCERDICWRVRVWDANGKEGKWSEVLSFKTASKLGAYEPLRYKSVTKRIAPVAITTNSAGRVVIDFGKDAWGWVELLPPMSMQDGGDFVLRIGEKLKDGAVDEKPGGTVRYARVIGALTTPGIYRVPFSADKRNTTGAAVKIPTEFGVVMPFRYVEVEKCPYKVTKNTMRMVALAYPMDMKQFAFVSSSPELDAIVALCKHTIWATSFAGVYIDGDRERIPYEADAYINQLSHYAIERDPTLARYSHEYLMKHPTWPTEWKQHSVMMAWADWMQTGDNRSLKRCLESLEKNKLLSQFARKSDGLLETKGPREWGNNSNMSDIVDWPPPERDGFEFKSVNAVINAFYCLNLQQMADIDAAVGETEKSLEFTVKAAAAKKAFHAAFFNEERGCYVDGEGAVHASLHANVLPLAFGLVPPEHVQKVADFVEARGMACSVYMAQYLLEALFAAGRDEAAIRLITRPEKRGWLNMIRLGSTMTLEAWDPAYKPNLDWNHAWATAPLNCVSRFILGVRPLEAGFGKMVIAPQTGKLEAVQGFVPTIRGRVSVGVRNPANGNWQLSFELPANTSANVELPRIDGKVTLDGNVVSTKEKNGKLAIDGVSSGKHKVEIIR